jgi:hypothetical protein
MDILRQGGVDAEFVASVRAEFILYWRERGGPRRTSTADFVAFVRQRWARYQSGLTHTREPQRLQRDWQPDPSVWDLLDMAGVDRQFAREKLPEFVLYWVDSNELHSPGTPSSCSTSNINGDVIRREEPMTKTQSVEELARSVARGIAASPTTSATQAGQTEHGNTDREALVEAINQVFALFRLNYANQFYAAWPDASELNQVKRLWLDALKDYPPEMILRGARYAIEHSEYLPNLSRMHDSCQQSLNEMGLPSVRDAYLEACNAPSPKAAYRWSHPAVFHAGAPLTGTSSPTIRSRSPGRYFASAISRWYCARPKGRLTLPARPPSPRPQRTPCHWKNERQRYRSCVKKRGCSASVPRL